MFGDAEIKYVVCAILVSEMSQSFQNHQFFQSKIAQKLFTQHTADLDKEIVRLLNSLKYASYLNISMCRLHCHHLGSNNYEPLAEDKTNNQSIWEIQHHITFKFIASASALVLCDKAIELQNTAEARLRKLWILERMRRY